MQITHLGHSAVLVEAAGARVLIDPGNFSDAWHGLTGLDAIVVTHQHPDHVDPDHVPALLDANPDAHLLVEPEVHKTLASDRAKGIAAGSTESIGGLTLRTVGGEHAVIHRDLPLIGNVGVVLEAEGEPRFFHPGDSLAACPAGIDVLALPAMGPWAAMKEHIEFARQVKAPQGFLIHEGLLSERGWGLATTRLAEMTPTQLADLRSGEATTF